MLHRSGEAFRINFPNVIIHRKPPNSCSSLVQPMRDRNQFFFFLSFLLSKKKFFWKKKRSARCCALATSPSANHEHRFVCVCVWCGVVNSHLIWHINCLPWISFRGQMYRLQHVTINLFANYLFNVQYYGKLDAIFIGFSPPLCLCRSCVAAAADDDDHCTLYGAYMYIVELVDIAAYRHIINKLQRKTKKKKKEEKQHE